MCEGLSKCLEKFYNTNADFRRFVDENAKGYGKAPSYILQTRTAREVYKEMQEGGINEHKEHDN
jgi:hypothetical protein